MCRKMKKGLLDVNMFSLPPIQLNEIIELLNKKMSLKLWMTLKLKN